MPISDLLSLLTYVVLSLDLNKELVDPKNPGRAEVLVPNTCELDTSQILSMISTPAPRLCHHLKFNHHTRHSLYHSHHKTSSVNQSLSDISLQQALSYDKILCHHKLLSHNQILSNLKLSHYHQESLY